MERGGEKIVVKRFTTKSLVRNELLDYVEKIAGLFFSKALIKDIRRGEIIRH